MVTSGSAARGRAAGSGRGMACRAAAGVVLQPGQLQLGVRVTGACVHRGAAMSSAATSQWATLKAMQRWQHSQAASHLGAGVKSARVQKEVLSNMERHLFQEPVLGRASCTLSVITVAFQQRLGS